MTRLGAWTVAPRRAALIGVMLCLGAARVQAVNPELNAFASFALPGLGQIFDRDYVPGAIEMGSYLVLYQQYSTLIARDDYIKPEDQLDNKNKTIATNHTTFYAELYGTMMLDLQFYSSYSAYRDARLSQYNEGYHTPMPNETLGDLALAPYSWKYLSRPTTYLVLILPLYAALAPPSKDQLVYQPDSSITRDEMARGFAVQFEGVAIGEEAFFRGVLNNGLSSGFGDIWGLVGSSAAFGLAHTGAPGQATPLLASAFGMYLGWLQQRNEYEIAQGVAIHFWWDFLISLGTLAKHDQNAQITLFDYVGKF
jgi:membrane protease YdiL (CAAX protease family)